MGTRTMIWAFFGVAALAAFWAGNNNAGYIFVVGGIIVTILHTIEVKLNKLLDDRGLRITKEDLSR